MNTPADPRLHGLYVVTDHAHCARLGLEASVTAALQGGARLVQYRDKSPDGARRFDEARRLSRLCAAHGALFIINDDAHLARAVAANGVHVGRGDMTVDEARRILGSAAIIGASCYDDLDLARQATDAGADYVAFGSVFPSLTKPDAARAPLELLARAHEALEVPVCAIGGINADNIAKVAHAGARMAAVVSAVFAAADIAAATRNLIHLFEDGARTRGRESN